MFGLATWLVYQSPSAFHDLAMYSSFLISLPVLLSFSSFPSLNTSIFITGTLDRRTEHDPLEVKVENAVHMDFDEHNERIKAYSAEIIKTIKDIVSMSPLYRESIHQVMDMGHKYVFVCLQRTTTTTRGERRED